MYGPIRRKRKRPWRKLNKIQEKGVAEIKIASNKQKILTTEENSNSYEIKPIRVRQNKIAQPKASRIGILPEHPFRMYVVGASGSGKSNLVLNLLSRRDLYCGYFDNIIVISPTALNVDTSYEVLNLDPENFFQPTIEVLEQLKQLQEKRIEEAKGVKNNVKKMLIIFDDIVSHKKFCNSPIFLQYAVMSRHWNISLMILSQAYHRIPKSVRLQMSSLIFFKGSNKELDALTDDFVAPGMSHKTFKNIVSNTTNKRFNFFYVDIHRPIGHGRYRKNLNHEIIK